MALLTQFYRAGDDEPAKMPHGWGWWHVQSFVDAYNSENPEPREVELTALTEYVYTDSHMFTDETDGEVLLICPGDRFVWWRDR
jgi:hypothetical protein